MLLRLLPQQVAEQWEVIKRTVEASTLPTENVDTNDLLTDLLDGKAQCWVSCRKENGTGTIEGVVITAVTKEIYGKTRSLFIHNLFGFSMETREVWESAFDTLVAFAKSEDCQRIAALTSVSSLVKLAERLGGDTRQRFISIPV